MDKASILGDTIEYVKQLRKRIQDLEAKCRLDDNIKVADKRKVRVVETGKTAVAVAVQVEVSIIENDALVEMQCRYRDGLLLDVMKRLRELGVEITTVQSSVDAGMFSAEMRAKVNFFDRVSFLVIWAGLFGSGYSNFENFESKLEFELV